MSDAAGHDVPTASRVELLARNIRRDIAAGRCAPGQRLIEADLVARYGYARSTVREALTRLATEGVVDLTPHKGAVVRRMTRRAVVDLYRVREALEGLAARMAAEQLAAGTAIKSPAVDEVRAWTKPRAAVPVSRFIDANRRFHAAIAALAGNAQLFRQLAIAEQPIFAFQFQALLTPDAMRKSAAEHRAISEAVLACNPARAEEAMRAHVGTAARLIATLGDEAFHD